MGKAGIIVKLQTERQSGPYRYGEAFNYTLSIILGKQQSLPHQSPCFSNILPPCSKILPFKILLN